jgi:hypothetical protein
MFVPLNNAVPKRSLDQSGGSVFRKDADVKLVGQEELDGSPVVIYQYSYAGPQGTGTRIQTRVWVGVGNGLPTKIEVESWTSQKGLQFTLRTTTTYFDYDADIVIEAPL